MVTPPLQSHHKPSALVLDDDPDFLAVIEVLLKKLGIQCHSTQTPEDFISKMKESRPDFCLIDLRIKGLTLGYTLVKAIRGAFGNEIPLFIVSADSDTQAIAHAIEIGATDYFTKPIDRELFATKISRYVTSPELSENTLSYFSIPQGGSPAELYSNEFKVLSIDEFGFTLGSPHLLTKGCRVKASGAFVENIFGHSNPITLSIVSTWANPSHRQFEAYAELLEPAEETTAKLRYWLNQQKTQTIKPKL